MITAIIRISDNAIVAYGPDIEPVDDTTQVVTLSDTQEQQLLAYMGLSHDSILLNTDGSLTMTPFVRVTPPPAPDIAGLIKALTASPSIDEQTKNALTTALEGS